jgi:hypothetical protein
VSRPLIVTGALTLFYVGTAFGAGPMIATLATPTEKEKEVLASIIWNCEGTTCTSVSTGQGYPSSACREIAKRFGQVVAFKTKNGDFDQSKLAQCNKGIESK